MNLPRDRTVAVWRRTIRLSWPVAAEQLFNTLMRTTDIIITALFSPAAVAAIGLADLYAQLSLRFGSGLGGGAIALSSQDTGRGAAADRDEAITQALAIGGLLGVPIVLFGLFFSRPAIAVLGADPETVDLGSVYLAIILVSAPLRIVGLIGTRALQGTGDTRTPMYVNVTSYTVNIAGSVALGLGVLGPRLGIVGVGVGTAAGNAVTAGGVLLALASPRIEAGLARPRQTTITRQLVVVSVPRAAEGLVTTLVYFPFNALLLSFGTSVNAGYQIGRRLYTQLGGPLYRAYNTTASIIVGQALGEERPEAAKFDGYAHAAFALLTLTVSGVALFFGAGWFVRLFADDAATITHAVGFARSFAVSMLFIGLFFSFSGALQGAGETRVPFLARLTGLVAFFLGFSYVASVVLDFGVAGTYVGIVLFYAWLAIVVTGSFVRGRWAARAAELIEARDDGVTG
ncbi:MAG: MATE family efflux transporter [Salinirussus sp.]